MAMLTKRISKRVVDSAHATEAEFTIWDDGLTGFGLRVQPSGAKSYVIVCRAGIGRRARVRKVTLGAVGKLAPDVAASWRRRRSGQSPTAKTRLLIALKTAQGSRSKS
jgi:hypothetical protein